MDLITLPKRICLMGPEAQVKGWGRGHGQGQGHGHGCG